VPCSAATPGPIRCACLAMRERRCWLRPQLGRRPNPRRFVVRRIAPAQPRRNRSATRWALSGAAVHSPSLDPCYTLMPCFQSGVWRHRRRPQSGFSAVGKGGAHDTSHQRRPGDYAPRLPPAIRYHAPSCLGAGGPHVGVGRGESCKGKGVGRHGLNRPHSLCRPRPARGSCVSTEAGLANRARCNGCQSAQNGSR